MKHRREVLRLTQSALGQLMGYQEDTISRYEREDRFPKNSAPLLIAALQIPDPYTDAVTAVVRRAKPVDSLPAAHQLTDVRTEELRRGPVAEESARWITAEQRAQLSAYRADRLIGRDSVLHRVGEGLSTCTPVLIRGFGGMGKTALAAEAAHRWIGSAPKAIVMWVQVGSAGVPQTLREIARCLDMEREVGRAVDNADAAEQIRARLSQTERLLVVLDDVWWSFDDFRWFVPNTVPDGAALLVTSRYLYALPGADRIELDQQGFEGAHGSLTLLAHYAAQTVESLLRDPAATDLCAFLGDLPLALQIAGHSMALGASPADLLDSAARTLDSLQFPADYGESEVARRRRGSVTATLNTSLDQLTDSVMRRVLFAFGSAFTPAMTRDLLALVVDVDAGRVQAALDDLSRRSLVRLIEKEGSVARYRVHDVAYLYLRERSAPTRAQQQRFAEACLRYVNEHAQDVAALYAERANILHAAAHAAESLMRPDILIDILYRLTVDSAYLGAYGHDDLLRTRLYEAIRAAEGLEAGQPEYSLMLHFMYSKLGNIEYLAGRLDESRAAYEDALRRAEQLGLPDREIILLGVLNRIFVDRHEFDTAAEIAERIQRKADALNDDYVTMRALEYRVYFEGQQ
ncbi:MAG: hypothetical protein IPM16_20800 [Chloroflexi bacterium]|nr:hypothetical protein [Chloroflexota bacterium]